MNRNVVCVFLYVIILTQTIMDSLPLFAFADVIRSGEGAGHRETGGQKKDRPTKENGGPGNLRYEEQSAGGES